MRSPGVPPARATWAVAQFGLAPLLLIAVDSNLEQRLACLMVYFALAWAVYFFTIVEPRASLTLGLGVALFTVAVGVPLGMLLVRNPPLSFADAMTSGPSIGRRFVGLLLADGLNEELLKALPLWLLAFGLRRIDEPSDGVFYGAMSGLGFAAFEGYRAIALAPDPHEMGTQMLVRTTALPFLHAIFTAIDGCFIALAAQRRSLRAAFCVLGLAVSSAIHGVYDFAPAFARFFVAGLAYMVLRLCMSRNWQRPIAHLEKNAETAKRAMEMTASGFSGPRIASGVLALLFVSAGSAAQGTASVKPQVPLREGLTIVSAHHDPRGDFEPITGIGRIDAQGVVVTLSTDEPSACGEPRGNQRSVARRLVRREDLEAAHAYRQEFTACETATEVSHGATAVGVSASVLRELNSAGQTNLSATTRVAGMVPGVLTRLERGTVPFKVILNDEPVELPAIHARWHSSVGDREYWILDDTANPLMLRGSYNGTAFLEVVKLSFPTGDTAARIARDLVKQGRAVLYGIYFDLASDRLKAESDAVLGDIAKALQQNPAWSLLVEGHTDSLGGDTYNLDLSKRRAAAVKQALVSRFNVDAARLQTTGFGASKPKDTNETLEGRARNRRVELTRKENK
jgi:RsiW-degrading membrane proteinase PrsW (M82 family)